MDKRLLVFTHLALASCFLRPDYWQVCPLSLEAGVLERVAVYDKSGLSGCRVGNRDWPIENWRY
ncbi:MAG: hypothetical protein KGZ75_05180 [Syntrophomonadaceae bacterium]|nr:hypothetical protein [Syntrophomonadaceae bacterium]